MSYLRHTQALLLCGLLTALCLGSVGCENNSDTLSSDEGGGSADFFITPGTVQLGLDDTMASFSVQGGDTPLTWTVSDPSLGAITDTDGRIANYRRSGTSEGINVVRATDPLGRTASVSVRQDDSTEDGQLKIGPSRQTIKEADGLATFQAVGGAPPYQWSVIDQALGSLSNTSQSFANYRRNGDAVGQNVIELKDSQGELVTAVVDQPIISPVSDDTATLRVTPGNPAIREADGVVTLQAIGGVPPYTWTVIDTSLGSLSNTSQSFANYRRNGAAAGVNVVELKDSRGAIAPAVIDQPTIPTP